MWEEGIMEGERKSKGKRGKEGRKGRTETEGAGW